jgi:ribosomal protein S18 acetylase RimI-like enzyme
MSDVRRVQPGDGERIRELWSLVPPNEVAAAGMFSTPFEDWEGKAAQYSEGDDYAMFVLPADDTSDGLGGIVMRMRVGPREAQVDALWVVPERRGDGKGHALLCAAIEWAKAAGFERIYLYVEETNRIALELYRQCGFVDKRATPAEVAREGLLRLGKDLSIGATT